MDLFQSIILGIIEGLTEFLPISSTAHMKFANPLLGVVQTPFNDMFEVVVQLAAILAVVVLYYKKFFDFSRLQFYVKLIVAVVPALAFGLVAKKYIDSALGNLTFIACVMIGGGIVLLFIDKVFTKQTILKEEQITTKTAFTIGCFQVLSVVFPGLSRSASTIIGGMSQKLTRSVAAEFSFFLAVPTMLAASIKSFYDACKDNYLTTNNVPLAQMHDTKVSLSDTFGGANLSSLFTPSNTMALAVGCIVSFIVAMIAVKFFIGFLKKYGFQVWGVYRIIAGGIMLALLLSGVIR